MDVVKCTNLKKPRAIIFKRLDDTIKIVCNRPGYFKCYIDDLEYEFINSEFKLPNTKEYGKCMMQICFIKSTTKYKNFVKKYKEYLYSTIYQSLSELHKL